jgi:RNA polymerase sigma-70 factor, ECF subfamily
VTPPWDDRDDRRLLARVAGGDRDALAQLYDRHAAQLFAHALALVRSRPDAEDLVQGAFLKLAGIGAPLLGIRSAGAYLHAMVRTAFLDGQRHRATAAEEPIAARNDAEPGAASDPDLLPLRQALGRLPAAQREAVVLHAVEGFTFREVAKMTGVPTWTAASRYRLGLARLRQILGVRS